MRRGRDAPPAVVRRLVFLGIVGLALLIMLIALITGFDRTGAGTYAVIRNGGPFDKRDVRQVLDPGSDLTWTGFWSETHEYPAQQRYYTITADPGRGERPGVDVVRVPTNDGVNVGLEGTIYFTLTGSHELLERLDNQFGTRKFRILGTGETKHPWEGDDGWAAFLDAIVRPVIDNDLRQEVGNFRCAELVSSCALVSNQNPGLRSGVGQRANVNIQSIQERINESLAADLQRTLGVNYFENIRFSLVRVELPPQVQRAVDDAQAEFANVSRDRAGVQRARLRNRANRELAKTFRANPLLALAEVFKSMPQGAQPVINVNVGGARGPGINFGR
jgi:regulator of protease activity HflC (stomatin/prohibitin superfamily)